MEGDWATARARYAKGVVRDILNRPSWGRGVGIGCAAMLGEVWIRRTSQCIPAVYIMVQRPEHIALARGLVGQSVYGVPVVIEAVGDLVAQASVSGAPTSPPPFGQPDGHLGGSYDWWWWSIGRHAGMAYEPTDERRAA